MRYELTRAFARLLRLSPEETFLREFDYILGMTLAPLHSREAFDYI